MSEVISLSKYRVEIAENSLVELLRELGGDDDLIKFAISKQQQIFTRTQNLSKLEDKSVAIPGSVSQAERETMEAEIREVVEYYRKKLGGVICDLTSCRLFLAEVKLYQETRC